jgi:hypothetical protein
MNVDKRITEEIKWAAPTFSYKGYNVSALEGAVKEWIRLKDRES